MKTHPSPTLLALFTIITILTLTPPAFPQQARSDTVEATLQAHFSAESNAPDAAALRKAGYTYNRLLVAEMLPSEATLFVEVELIRGETRLRYPLKLARKTGNDTISWQVDWAPVAEYARSLTEIASDEALASLGQTDTAWTDVERLPAFPVIVANRTFVTPYGRLVTASDTDPKTAASATSKALAEHAQRWVGLTLEDEPGTANVDLILDGHASWRRATQALIAPASMGLFRTYLVGRSQEKSGKVVALATAAPVVRQTQDGAAPLIMGMYRAGEEYAFRVRVGDDLVENAEACADKMTFCAESLDAFERQALDHVTAALEAKQSKLAYVMFAATGEVPAEHVARHLDRLASALGVSSSKIFVGFIRKGDDG